MAIKIGRDITSAQTVEEALRLAELDWTVEKNQTFANRALFGSLNLVQSEKFVSIMRSDTGEEFAHPTTRYEVVQNLDSFKWVENLTAEGATFWRAGSFRGGRKTFMIVKLPLPLTLSQGDTIERAVIITSSHDSSSGIKANWLPFRIECSNVIAAAIASAPMVFRHTVAVRNGISPELAREMLFNADVFYDAFYKRANALSSAPFTDGDMETLIDTIFQTERVSNNRIRRSNDFLYESLIQNFRNGRETYGSTMWDAYNAICEYLDYQRPIGNRTETFGESEDGEVRDERYYNSLVSASRYGGVRIRNNTMEYLSERLTEYEGYIQSGV